MGGLRKLQCDCSVATGKELTVGSCEADLSLKLHQPCNWTLQNFLPDCGFGVKRAAWYIKGSLQQWLQNNSNCGVMAGMELSALSFSWSGGSKTFASLGEERQLMSGIVSLMLTCTGLLVPFFVCQITAVEQGLDLWYVCVRHSAVVLAGFYWNKNSNVSFNSISQSLYTRTCSKKILEKHLLIHTSSLQHSNS